MCDLHLGFIVSAACNPIPHWLVQRIQNGEFVEMRELLADNIYQLEDFCGHPLVSAPVYGRFPRFHCGCTALQRTWKSLHRTLGLVRCWPTAGSLFVRHSGMGAMAGLSTIVPFGVSGFVFALAFACSWSAGSYHFNTRSSGGQF